MTKSGRLCAFITKVKRGSLADTVGHLRPGEHIYSDLTFKLISFNSLSTVEGIKAFPLKPREAKSCCFYSPAELWDSVYE